MRGGGSPGDHRAAGFLCVARGSGDVKGGVKEGEWEVRPRCGSVSWSIAHTIDQIHQYMRRVSRAYCRRFCQSVSRLWGVPRAVETRGSIRSGRVSYMPGSSADLMFNHFRWLAVASSDYTLPRSEGCCEIPQVSEATFITVAPIGLHE